MHFGSLKARDLPERTWTSVAVESFYRDLIKAPQVVFLGSSLMLTPLNMTDAKILGRTLDGSRHHQSIYFGALVKKLTGREINTFNFSLPGEMPSDAYLITKLLLRGTKKPEVIIYGVGPRDFMDNLLDSPVATDPYRYLSKLDSHGPDSSFVGHRWDQQLDYWLTRLVYPYGKKEDISTQAQLRLQKLLISNLCASTGVGQLTWKQKRTLLGQSHTMEIAEGECLFYPVIAHDANRFNDNLGEYKQRYGVLNWNTFLVQLNFLAKLLDTARAQHINAVIVAMPITSVNRRLIPEFTWQAYKSSLRVITISKAARFVDLESSDQFCDDDFGDTVHLNTIGGIKLVQVLVEQLLQDGKLTNSDRAIGQVSGEGPGKDEAL
jgi:hypothetical protein